jgi:hypothetical protein
MSAVYILAVAAFDTVLSITEIPKMLNDKMYRELAVFSILLLLGTALAVMKIVDINIPNPTDLIIWFFSPVSSLMKGLMQSG